MPDTYSKEEIENSKLSRETICNYLTNSLKEKIDIELFICWDGDQDKLPELKGTINPEDLTDPAFWIEEKRAYYKVI